MSHKCSCRNIFWPQIRNMCSKTKPTVGNHYDSLGVTSKATQADIKSAYYKLSMLHHPDKNKESESSVQKFRDISAAYEVLGNVKSRKMYDRGLLVNQGTPTSSMYEEPVNKFYKSRESRTKPPTMYATRETIYDFDNWTKAHYGATFARKQGHQRSVKFNTQAEDEVEKKSQEARVLFIVLIIAYTFCLFIFETEDRVVTPKKPKNT